MNSDHMDLTVVRYECKTPLSDKVMFVVGVIGIIVALVYNNWS